jgi:hypothetical protein
MCIQTYVSISPLYLLILRSTFLPSKFPKWGVSYIWCRLKHQWQNITLQWKGSNGTLHAHNTIHGTVNTKVLTKEIIKVPLYTSTVSTVIVGDNVRNTWWRDTDLKHHKAPGGWKHPAVSILILCNQERSVSIHCNTCVQCYISKTFLQSTPGTGSLGGQC